MTVYAPEGRGFGGARGVYHGQLTPQIRPDERCSQHRGASFPIGTLLINVTGSFGLGLFLAATTGRLIVDPRWRLLFAIGFLGAYTTFSTYTYESVQLLLAGNWWYGLTNLAASNLLGLGASVLGIILGRRL